MRIRISSLLLALLFVPSLAHADGHKADFYSGFLFGDGGSRLSGFHQSLGIGLRNAPRVTIIAPDLSVRFGGHEGKDLTEVGFQFGMRVHVTSLAPANKFFVSVVGGGVYTNDGTTEAGTNGAGAIGFGYEYFKRRGEVSKERPNPPHVGLGFRAQIDYVMREGRESFTRVSAGVVYRFDRH
jgi:hypothetical protein